MRDHDIVIAGGGLTGLVLARTLAGVFGPAVRLAILDAGGSERADPRSYALSAGSRRLLEAIGVWAEVSAEAQPVSGIDITDSSLSDAIRPILLSYDTDVGEGEPGMWIVPADALHQAAQAIASDTAGIVRISGTATGLSADTSQITLRLADAGALTAGLVVACDGRASPLRAAAGIGTVERQYAQTGIVATVRHERPHGGRAVQHFLPAGPFAILPMTGNRSCVTWTEDAGEAARILALDDVGFLGELEKRFGYRLGALELAGPRGSWPLAMHLARELIGPRFALAGDAVRGVHPIAGQGLNLALRDVAALSECLIDAVRVGLDVGDATALERYARWRRFDGAASAAAFSALNVLFSQDNALLRSVRDAGLGVVDRLPGLKQYLVSEAAGLTGEVPKLLKGEALAI
ncbi:MAG TPA: FAD-dependent monooxygenase [Hyphomicrobiaceae bacterium]|nr:FAD-dependent monooxygenase [Hyphomicrobiaceae bacterium]